MSLNKNKPTGFSLHKSRNVPKQPPRNLNLKYIVNNSREDIIIIPKEKIDILRRDFDWFNIIIDNLENDDDDDNYDEDGNILLRKSTWLLLDEYTYFNDHISHYLHGKIVNSIPRDKMFDLIHQVINKGYVPIEYVRIMTDYLMPKEGVSLSPPRKDSRPYYNNERESSYYNNEESNYYNNEKELRKAREKRELQDIRRTRKAVKPRDKAHRYTPNNNNSIRQIHNNKKRKRLTKKQVNLRKNINKLLAQ